eukprot:CAMPEP_0194276652 /NCGR_PEP_ID=MMETSP0169-20130528/9185_1 /TAXON_ID=218684 /ORGANISM="Corethron pennatum, Strain L29A3" /LENGTH=778 /DNA_ID=CAMNT_0039020415 /DNA_START=81 /DNA_END=2417 /DNA_ORIENTATION=-
MAAKKRLPDDNTNSSTVSSGKYAVDIRKFIVFIFAITIVSFSLGSIYGPVRNIGDASASSQNRMKIDDIPAIERKEGWTELLVAPVGSSGGSGAREQTDAEVVEGISHRRALTNNIADFGLLIDKTEGPEYNPAGQHLLVDMRNVSYSFLDDAEALAAAIVELIRVTHHTLLSHHCHKLIPAGVSCVGVLLESHISFHTWPEEGVITFDLFTCGGTPLIAALPLIEKYFGIPREEGRSRGIGATHEDPTKVVTQWVHQLRGFRTNEQRASHVMDDKSDLAWAVLTNPEVSKNQIISTETSQQRVDIWDINDLDEAGHSIFDMMDGPFPIGDPRYRSSSQYITPSRMFFLNGIYKSGNQTERVLHEALVHPVMFAHEDPKRVAILGRGEAGALREVLKHKTVDSVVMFENDKSLLNIIKEHIPTLCDCSNQEGTADVCFDDARTEINYSNALDFFTENFDKKGGKKGDVEKFDVIVVNDLERQENSVELLDSMIGSLTQDGTIVINLGPHNNRLTKLREEILSLLELRLGTVLVYEENRVWHGLSFVVGCLSKSCRNRWYAKNDVIDYEVNSRTVSSTDASPLFVNFDGGTQHGYKFTPKAWENLYCRREPEPAECQYRSLSHDKEIINWESGFEMQTDKNGHAGIFATRNIGVGSYIVPEEASASIFLSADTLVDLVDSTSSVPGTSKVEIKEFVEYANKYGRESLTEGHGNQVIDVGPIIQVKVGNDDNANIARISTLLPPLPSYSPVFERNRRMFDTLVVATSIIRKGEEVFLLEN